MAIRAYFILCLAVTLAACGGGETTSPRNNNTPPSANAGTDQTVNEGTTVQLSGSGSDTEGPVTFSWSQTTGAGVTLSNTNIANPTFQAPQVNAGMTETLTFRLTVTDTNSATATDDVVITVNDNINTPPSANAGANQTVNEGTTVQLSGSGSDAEGPVTFSWSQTTGAGVTLSNTNIANPTFQAPQVGAGMTETLTFRLTVTDTNSATATDEVVITVNDVVTPVRPSNTTCLAGNAQTFSAIRHRNAFNRSFNQPVAMIPLTGSDILYIVERQGTVQAFNPTTLTASIFANISSMVDTNGEGGLLGMAFDPNYSSNGVVYLSYTTNISGAMYSRVSRFNTNAQRTAIDPASEVVLLEIRQPYTNHNGGQIAFDTSGNLYIGLGDGGSGHDPQQNAQNRTNLLGAMLRINPNMQDNTGRNLNYGIPTDNPYYGNTDCSTACPEIFAWGLRNPWRWSFDRGTGALFAGDVGQSTREEIDIIQSGGNYGWGCYEGTLRNGGYGGDCTTLENNPSLHTLPIHDYPRSDGTSVTGGYVYRGSNIPGLVGEYIFADYGSGQVWAISDPYSNPQRRTLFNAGGGVVSLAEDNNGELYLINIFSNEIHIIEPDPNSPGTLPFATQLSQTGCANNTDPKLPSNGLIPYEINAPLWSDNADKSRWLSLPDNTTIDIDANHDWQFPIGSVLRKDFYLNNQIVETRLLARHNDGSWAGYSYEWNQAQTDATLLTDTKTISVAGQQWTFPSRAQCLNCHTAAAGRVLGPETAQMNRTINNPLGAGQINQLDYLDLIGMFTTSPGSPGSLPVLASYDDVMATPTQIARAYLHSNCSHCHQPGGTGRGNMNLLYATTFSNMNICNVTQSFGMVNGANLLLDPGNISNSVVYQRMTNLAGSMRMPPVGTAIEDTQGLGLIANWITSVAVCP